MEYPKKRMWKLIFVLKSLLLSYIVTGGLLLLLAFVLYKVHISENAVNFCITVIYILTSFLAGFITGKKFGEKKFIWGAGMGILYFAILFLVSLIIRKSFADLGTDFGLTFFICAGSGMLGGMLS